MQRHKLADMDTVEHPRYGMFMVRVIHRDNVIPHDVWEGFANGKKVVPSFYTERGLHFYLTRSSWKKPPYRVTSFECKV